jgi:DNA-binding transcriptional regulator PaaX
LIFDIPEYRKSTRDRIRETLRIIGFVRLQDSVWAYPYDCEDLITLLKADFKIGKDMLYLVVEAMENDASLRRHFGI